jgi:uridine phosphorylase
MANVAKNRFFTSTISKIIMTSAQTPIGASELVITPKQTIYHLDLLPEMLADTVITVGDPGRVEIVSKYFDRIEHRASHREFITHTGYIGSKRVSVVSTGIGPDNIDIVWTELDALVNIDFATRLPKADTKSLSIIRLGTSGSLHEDIPVDSFVVSSFGIGLDNVMHFYQFENNAEESFILNEFIHHSGFSGKTVSPYIAEGSIRLRNLFSDGFKQGITVTCPGFYGPQGRHLRAPITFPNLPDALATFHSGHHRIVNFEMETSAMYGLSKVLGHNCLSISNVIDNRVHKNFSADSKGAMDNMIKKSLEIIERM